MSVDFQWILSTEERVKTSHSKVRLCEENLCFELTFNLFPGLNIFALFSTAYMQRHLEKIQGTLIISQDEGYIPLNVYKNLLVFNPSFIWITSH